MANSHRKSNYIDRIRIEGVWVEGKKEIKRGIANAFQELLSDLRERRTSVEGLNFSRLNGLGSGSLESSFSELQIFSALKDLNGDKASGLDGFTMAFCQQSWDVIKSDLMDFFEFYKRRRFVQSLNATFLVLFPKRKGAEDLKDFKPISLIGSLYKLLAKILSNRLKVVMTKLVNKAQNPFVEGRQILDTSLIANEVIDSITKKKENGFLCKLDIEKAYDHIGWEFVLHVLQKMGFGESG